MVRTASSQTGNSVEKASTKENGIVMLDVGGGAITETAEVKIRWGTEEKHVNFMCAGV